MSDPFWKTTPLEAMTDAQWEALCDGCGKCCLNKLEDDETGEIVWTDIACTLLEHGTCRCQNYENRTALVPDCVALDANAVRSLSWLPKSCGYRRIAEGRDLAWWHPLVSGDPQTVHIAGVSVLGRIVSEDDYAVDEYESRVVDWPDKNAG